MTLQWVAANARTGQVVADVPTFAADWPLRRSLCKYETATGKLYLDGAPPNWPDAIREGGAVLAVYDDADPALAIQWAGLVTQQTRDTGEDSVAVSLVTAEGYLDRRFVGDYGATGQGQNEIASDLVTLFAADSANVPGMPFVVELVGTTDPVRDRTFALTDNATVYTRLTQLSAIDGGIEFTVAWEWSSDNTALVPVVKIGDRIGISPLAGRQPAASFTMPGNVVNAQQTRDYTDGKGANNVTAYSSGQGSSTPTSGPIVAADFEGRPTFEYRYQPSSSIIDTATLTNYATKALAVLSPGARAVTLTCALLDETRHGGLWSIGDDVFYQLGGTQPDGSELVAAFPGGLSATARAIAYELTDTTVAPILADVSIPGGTS